jgi:hypothetical protein
VAKAWVGFWAVLVPPSPKLQDQEVGLPVEVSVNCTDWLVLGEAGAKLKPDAGETTAGLTVTLRVARLVPPALPAVRVTEKVPAVVNV